MSDRDSEAQSVKLESEVREMKLETDESADMVDACIPEDGTGNVDDDSASSHDLKFEPSKVKSRSTSHSPTKSLQASQSPVMSEFEEKTIGAEIVVEQEAGKPAKLSRKHSQKMVGRPPALFHDLSDSTPEACSSFEVIKDCTYGAKYLGSTEYAMDCDCSEEWDPGTKTNHACGEDSDCINRATKMECSGDCGCGTSCQNQRFQRKQYAKVTVIKTEKKGYGLRADADLQPHDFIFEYIGEVINEPNFRRRMHQYDEEGIKHFYFMSLSKGEFVDATKKGNLGRFCNHSCNPNCYVDKWVVGDKLRMGIFAERKIKAGEELVFNYNVDRYGANPQPCYCGEPNCTGYIGGKTQTDTGTKLSNATIEALGIEDGDDWDTAVAKKPRKKKNADDDDEEYVSNVQPKALDEDGVTKVMATLMQCKEKWIAVKLLSRIQRAPEEKVLNRVVKMHGYQILNSALNTFNDDDNVVLQILDILDKLPRITRNKIQDSKIEPTVQKLMERENETLAAQAANLIKIWAALEVGYRIPRMKRDPNAVAPLSRPERIERREVSPLRSRSRSRDRTPDAPRGPSAPTGPRSNIPQRNMNFFPGSRPPFRRPPFNALPPGWFAAQSNGQTYYYSASGETTWQRPTQPAPQPPPPPKVLSHEQKLQEIINSITSQATPKEKPSAAVTPQAAETPKPYRKEEKWKSYSEDKQMKIYENTLFPHIKYVMDKFKGKLPKEDVKRFGKEIAKKLVASDFKHKRVQDPTKISDKQKKQVKNHVKEYFDKAYAKRKEHDKKRADRRAKEGKATTPPGSPPVAYLKEYGLLQEDEESEDDQMNDISDDEPDDPSPTELSVDPLTGSPALKRKRDTDTPGNMSPDGDASSSKRMRDEVPPPPPPPPPPLGERPADDETPGLMEDVDGQDDAAVEPISITSNESPSEAQIKNDGYAEASPMQLATPPLNNDTATFTNSLEEKRKNPYEGMNPERMRQLGYAKGY